MGKGVSFPVWSGVLVLGVLALGGCVNSELWASRPVLTLYGEAYPARAAEATVDVYNVARPMKPYKEIAEISCADPDNSWNMTQILVKAREIGADAVIVTRKAGSDSFQLEEKRMLMSEDNFGMTVVAIRYQDSATVESAQ